ncbi:cytochrome P450 [Sphaerimonospora cavernae]|uniref:Cytochrome P450 n=1 Tax=Sphaerimonospora cavernae TaxID=1740611 RepID=A0ABV6TZ15_9ACTN
MSLKPDPCGDYLGLRGYPPIHRDDVLGVWVVTGFNEVTAMLRHPGLSSSWPDRGNTKLHAYPGGADGNMRTSDTVRRWFMFMDGERHRILRRIVAPLFAADRIAELEPFIGRIVDELLDGVTDGHLDVMADLVIPLSSRAICRILGLPSGVAPRLHGWAQDVAALLIADYLPQVVERGTEALRQIEEAVGAAQRRPGLPGDSGIGLLMRAERAGLIERLDISATASLLVYAGFETTSTFLGKAVRAVLHAGDWPALTETDPAAAVEELLRFDTSVQQVARVARNPVEISGTRIERGDLVLLMLGAANRDSRAFVEPDSLDLARVRKRHLAFGQGAHYCLGPGLARLEARVVIDRLTSRWKHTEPASPPVARKHYGVSVLEHVEIQLAR